MRLYLAFILDEAPYDPSLGNVLVRLARGPFRHVEIVIKCDDAVVRYVVPQPTADRPAADVHCSGRRFSPEVNWRFLELLYSRARVRQIYQFLDAAIQRGDFFSYKAMYRSGLPWVPEWLLDKYCPEDPVGRGKPTFCGKLCVEALQAAGLLEFVPADMCNASDVYSLALIHLNAIADLAPFAAVSFVDAAGYAVSKRYALNV